jgi:hypothetical protein
MPGSMPAGGQITPFDRDNSSLRFALPAVSPGTGNALLPRWQSPFGDGKGNGGAGRSDCGDAKRTPLAVIEIRVTAMIQGRMDTS